ncbi:MAG: hypothetical protein ABIJ57_17290 [Pseudomonadota bacterium]
MKRFRDFGMITAALVLLLGISAMVFAENKSPMFSRQVPGGLFAVINETQTTGNIWFVDSGSSNASDAAGYGQNPDAPFATIDYAIGQCTASNGDWIVVMPGHAESISSAAGINVDVAGIRIIGLGVGDSRPVLSWTGAAGTLRINTTDFQISNFVFRVGDALSGVSVVKGIEIRSGASNVAIANSDFMVASTSGATVCALPIDISESNKTYVTDCRFFGTHNAAAVGGTGVTAVIRAGNRADNLQIKNCYFDSATGNTPFALIQAISGASGFLADGLTARQNNPGASPWNIGNSVEGIIKQTAISTEAIDGRTGVTWFTARKAAFNNNSD